MLRQSILLIIGLMILAGCAGTKQTEYYDTEPYVQEEHCISPGNCLGDSEVTTPPGYVKNPSSPGMTPPVSQPYYMIPPAPLAPQPMPVYPQEYRYSGVGSEGYHWGRINVDSDGTYRGWDNKGGFSWGTISPQGYYQPPPTQPQPIYPQEYHYSGIQNGELHFGNVNVQPDGSYSGFDSKGGIFFGNMEVQ